MIDKNKYDKLFNIEQQYRLNELRRLERLYDEVLLLPMPHVLSQELSLLSQMEIDSYIKAGGEIILDFD